MSGVLEGILEGEVDGESVSVDPPELEDTGDPVGGAVISGLFVGGEDEPPPLLDPRFKFVEPSLSPPLLFPTMMAPTTPPTAAMTTMTITTRNHIVL